MKPKKRQKMCCNCEGAIDLDDVMNKQRQEVYAFRNDILFAEQPITIAEELLEGVAKQAFGQGPGELAQHFPLSLDKVTNEQEAAESVLSAFQQKIFFQRQLLSSFRPELNEATKSQGVLQEVMRNLMVREIDHLWQGHLLHIDHLRSDVHMRTVGQKDPLTEFKHESFALFEAFSTRLRQEIARNLFRFEMVPQPPASPATPSRRRRTPIQRVGG